MRWCLVSVWTKTCIETCSSNVRDLQCFYILLSLFLFIIIGLEIDIFLKSSIVRITQPQSCTMWFQTGPNLWSIASLFFTSLCGTLQLKGTKFHHPATVPFRPPAGFFRGCRVGFWVWYIHSCFNLCSAGFGMFRMYSQKKKNTLKGFSHGGFNAPMVSFFALMVSRNKIHSEIPMIVLTTQPTTKFHCTTLLAEGRFFPVPKVPGFWAMSHVWFAWQVPESRHFKYPNLAMAGAVLLIQEFGKDGSNGRRQCFLARAVFGVLGRCFEHLKRGETKMSATSHKPQPGQSCVLRSCGFL